ncbi:MAG: DUF1772 domain-containing protein [Brevibacterium aurantiacum]|nr:DUF1772 domain-containing protein [Brevibacterium aurantiacum]
MSRFQTDFIQLQTDFVQLLPDLIVLTAAITNGLLAGVFFAFSCAVAPGLRRVDDGSYVRVVRAVNSAILNGWFLTIFFFAPLTAVASAAAQFLIAGRDTSATLFVGAICSILTFAITSAVNVPLNRGLEEASIETADTQHLARIRYETRWNLWNLMRTLTSVASLICLSAA